MRMNDEPAWFSVSTYKERMSPDFIDVSKKLHALLGSTDPHDTWWWWGQKHKAFGMAPYDMWFEDKQRVIEYVNRLARR